MRNLPPEEIEGVLDAMELALERGSYPSVQFFINDYEEAFLSAPLLASRQRYFSMKVAAEAGLAYEKKFGRYTLLKREHPISQLFIAQGILRLPSRHTDESFSEAAGSA